MTGILYLLVVLTGIAGELLVRTSLFVAGDAAATVDNIATHESVFRLGFLISLTRFAFFILLVLALYRLLRPVDRYWSLVMISFALVSIAVGMVSLLFQYASPLLLSGSDYSAVFTPDQWHAQVQFFIDLQTMVDRASQILSVWLVPLGYLVYKSGFLPRVLGVLVVIAGIGYVADLVVFLLLPDLDVQIAGYAFIAEVPLLLWLLVKGVDVERWRSRAAASRGTTTERAGARDGSGSRPSGA